MFLSLSSRTVIGVSDKHRDYLMFVCVVIFNEHAYSLCNNDTNPLYLLYFCIAMQTHYVLLLCSFKEQLQQHVRVHAMEAVMACWEIEQSLQSLTGDI